MVDLRVVCVDCFTLYVVCCLRLDWIAECVLLDGLFGWFGVNCCYCWFCMVYWLGVVIVVELGLPVYFVSSVLFVFCTCA